VARIEDNRRQEGAFCVEVAGEVLHGLGLHRLGRGGVWGRRRHGLFSLGLGRLVSHHLRP